MIIIGIAGKAGSGKTTLANFIKKDIKEQTEKRSSVLFVEVTSFAHRLKQISLDIFQLKPAQVYTIEKETIDPRFGVTPREIMQRLGSFCREFDKNFWVNNLMSHIQYFSNNYVWIIDDVRYLNELEGLKDKNSILIRMERDESLRPKTTNPNHPSEVDLDNKQKYFDYIVYNNGSMEELKERAKLISGDVLKELGG